MLVEITLERIWETGKSASTHLTTNPVHHKAVLPTALKRAAGNTQSSCHLVHRYGTPAWLIGIECQVPAESLDEIDQVPGQGVSDNGCRCVRSIGPVGRDSEHDEIVWIETIRLNVFEQLLCSVHLPMVSFIRGIFKLPQEFLQDDARK
jgi:hypothetical protein